MLRASKRIMKLTRIFFHFLLLMNFVAVGTGEPSCSVLSCPPPTTVYENKDFTNVQYATGNCFTDSEDIGEMSSITCAMHCRYKDCSFFGTDENSCILSGMGFGRTTSSQMYFAHKSTPVNLALNKPITCSSERYDENLSLYGLYTHCTEANNGKTDDAIYFYHSSGDANDFNPWVVIDLGARFAIHKIRHLPRLKFDYRTSDVTYYLGDVEVTDGTFSGNGYEQIWFYAGPYNFDAMLDGQYFLEYILPEPKCGRYFAMKKENTDSSGWDYHMMITEIEVYTE